MDQPSSIENNTDAFVDSSEFNDNTFINTPNESTAINVPTDNINQMSVDTSTTGDNEQTEIPAGMPLTNIYLPNQWVLYTYDKQVFKKMANKPNFQAKPHKELCTIKTVNDLIYILQLMAVGEDLKSKAQQQHSKNNKINLDLNDYIIMRKGIEPIWEDPKNSNGGTFTIKMPHAKGYDVWSTFVMFMLGETLTYDMQNINGITVSHIPDASNFHNHSSSFHHNPAPSNINSHTYIKIWDGKSNRTLEQFKNILPMDLMEKIRNVDNNDSISLRYSRNNEKEDFNKKNIVNKLNNNNQRYGGRDRGGFSGGFKRR